MKPHPVLDVLQKASAGLLFPSETESELQPFMWQPSDAPTPARLREQAGCAADAAVEETTLADLLRTVPSDDRAKYQALRTTLESQLAGIKVCKIGDEAEKAVYIVGKTADGCWAGLKTMVVET
jgi:hypothetical protein